MIKTTGEGLPYQTRFTNGQDAALADTTKDKGGNGSGFRPHELLEAALASCMNMAVRMHAEKLSIPITGVSTTVRLDRSNPDEVVFDCNLEIEGDMTDEDRRRLSEVARSCPVRTTLSKTLKFKD